MEQSEKNESGANPTTSCALPNSNEIEKSKIIKKEWRDTMETTPSRLRLIVAWFLITPELWEKAGMREMRGPVPLASSKGYQPPWSINNYLLQLAPEKWWLEDDFSFGNGPFSVTSYNKALLLGGEGWHRRGTICFSSPWYAFIQSPKDLSNSQIVPKMFPLCLFAKQNLKNSHKNKSIYVYVYIYMLRTYTVVANVETRSSQTIPMRPSCQEAFMESQLWRQKWHILGRLQGNRQGFQGFWWFQHVITSWLAPPQYHWKKNQYIFSLSILWNKNKRAPKNLRRGRVAFIKQYFHSCNVQDYNDYRQPEIPKMFNNNQRTTPASPTPTTTTTTTRTTMAKTTRTTRKVPAQTRWMVIAYT